MPEPPPLSLAEWVVLAVVDEAPAHGFAIACLVAPEGDLGRIWHIPRPMVYRALPRLAAAGLVREDEATAGQGPDRHPYAVTSAGHRAVARWLETPVDHVREVRSELLLKLALLDRRGRLAATLVERQRARFADIETALLTESAASGFEETLRRWRRANLRATVEFLEQLSGS